MGWRVLDLFAGSGALGLEALSRGAAEVLFVDSSRPALQVLRSNLEGLGFQERGRVVCLTVREALPRFAAERFQLALLDPPYLLGALGPAIQDLVRVGLIMEGGEIVALHSSREAPPQAPDGWSVLDTRRSGDSSVTTYGPYGSCSEANEQRGPGGE